MTGVVCRPPEITKESPGQTRAQVAVSSKAAREGGGISGEATSQEPGDDNKKEVEKEVKKTEKEEVEGGGRGGL